MPILRGRVVDRDTGRGIAFLVVALNGKTTSTDPQGEFEIFAPPGTYTLRIRSPFYEPYTREIELREDTYIEIKLRRTIL